MDASRHSILMAHLSGLNNECKIAAWMDLPLDHKKSVWPELPKSVRESIYINLNEEERFELEHDIMDKDEVAEMREILATKM